MGQSREQRQQSKNQYQREANQRANEIAPLPPVVQPDRRQSCQCNLRLFCDLYFPAIFNKPFGEDHLQIIAAIEQTVKDGGQMAIAMPRGSGKTSLVEVAAIWAIVYGHRHYVTIISATDGLAKNNLNKIKSHLETNERLFQDFPEVCYPIRKLERVSNRAGSQHLCGKPTHIAWKVDRVGLPCVPDSLSSGALIDVIGMTGAIRGRATVDPMTGAIRRPDFVMIDDFQTKKSASAQRQCDQRLQIINSDIMGLAGPGQSVAAFACVTVIEKGDAADRLLDRKLFPQWRGKRTRLLKTLPTDTKLWDQYAELWATSLQSEAGDIKAATEFYKQHQKEMDAGAEASWLHRFETGELSAIQHGMNLKLKSDTAFWAEYQNEPLSQQQTDQITIEPSQITAKIVAAYPRGFVPDSTVKLTAFIDVQKDVLFYLVAAWSDGFAGHVVEYGTWPDQGRLYFGLRDLTKTINKAKPGTDRDGQLYHALDTLVNQLADRKWFGTDKTKPFEISRLLIDSNWGESTSTVRLFAKQTAHKRLIIPSQGVGITAKKKPFSDYRPEDGIRCGWNWRHDVRNSHIRYDTNAFKSLVAGKLIAGMGEAGTITVHQMTDGQSRLLVEHLTSEFARPMSDNSTGRTVNEWEALPNRDNHWWDCLVGAAVAASEQGIASSVAKAKTSVKKKRARSTATF